MLLCPDNTEVAFALQGASDETIAATMAPSPDDPQTLTEEELHEREHGMQITSAHVHWLNRPSAIHQTEMDTKHNGSGHEQTQSTILNTGL